MNEDRSDTTTDQSNGEEQIREHVRNALDARLPGRNGSNVTLRRYLWFWRDHFPKGKTSELCGDPGNYKTGVALELSARITVGAPFPTEPEEQRREPGKVLFFSAEDDDNDTLLPRFLAAGGNRELIQFVTPIDDLPSLPEDAPKLREWIKIWQPVLVVFDPLDAFFGKKIDANSNPDVRRALRPLVRLGSQTQTTFFLIRHLNKDLKLGRAMYRAAGSIGTTATTRGSYILGPQRDDSGTYIFACTKLNGAPKPRSLRYQVEAHVLKGYEKEVVTQRVKWLGETDATADDVVQEPTSAPGPKPEKSGMAELIIKTHLKDGQWHPSQPIIAFAKERGVSYDTVDDVAKALGVKRKRDGYQGPSIWCLPQESPPNDPKNTESVRTPPDTPKNSPSMTESLTNPYGEKDFAIDGVPHEDSNNSPSMINPLGERDFDAVDGVKPDHASPSMTNSFSPNGFDHSGEAENPRDGELRGPSGNRRPKSDPDPSADGIPFVITQAMRVALHELGFREDEISRMTPAEAHDIICRGEGIFRFDEEVDDDER